MGILHLVGISLCVFLPLVASDCLSKGDQKVFKDIRSTIQHAEQDLDNAKNRLLALERKLNGPSCGPGWDSFRGKCYYFSNDRKTWNDAQKKCDSMSSNLVKVDDKAESDWLKKQSKAKDSKAQRWIGARELNGKWVWASDFTSLTFDSWANGEPNNKKENCGHIDRGKNFNWNDHFCTQNFNYICERTPCQG